MKSDRDESKWLFSEWEYVHDGSCDAARIPRKIGYVHELKDFIPEFYKIQPEFYRNANRFLFSGEGSDLIRVEVYQDDIQLQSGLIEYIG